MRDYPHFFQEFVIAIIALANQGIDCFQNTKFIIGGCYNSGSLLSFRPGILHSYAPDRLLHHFQIIHIIAEYHGFLWRNMKVVLDLFYGTSLCDTGLHHTDIVAAAGDFMAFLPFGNEPLTEPFFKIIFYLNRELDAWKWQVSQFNGNFFLTYE